ncbi:hypothetical protein ACLOJK_029564 [Asimina triloba]
MSSDAVNLSNEEYLELRKVNVSSEEYSEAKIQANVSIKEYMKLRKQLQSLNNKPAVKTIKGADLVRTPAHSAVYARPLLTVGLARLPSESSNSNANGCRESQMERDVSAEPREGVIADAMAARVIFIGSASRDQHLRRISLELVPFGNPQRLPSPSLPPLRRGAVGQVWDFLSPFISLPVSIPLDPPSLSRSPGLLPLSPCLDPSPAVLPLSPSRSLPSRSPHPSRPAPCFPSLPVVTFSASLLHLSASLLHLSPDPSLLRIPPPSLPGSTPSASLLPPSSLPIYALCLPPPSAPSRPLLPLFSSSPCSLRLPPPPVVTCFSSSASLRLPPPPPAPCSLRFSSSPCSLRLPPPPPAPCSLRSSSSAFLRLLLPLFSSSPCSLRPLLSPLLFLRLPPPPA